MTTTQHGTSVHHARIGSQVVPLDILPLPDSAVGVSLLMTLDEGWRFNKTAGRELAGQLAEARPEVVAAPVTLGIPVMLYAAEALGVDCVPLYKTPKFHFGDALREQVTSVTTPGREQMLYLDRRHVARLAGKRVALVDDVACTAETLAGALRLVRSAGGTVVKIGVLLTEGVEWRARLGADAQLVTSLGHIPMFRRDAAGGWEAIPATLG
jgi:adenine/guanine phosphoribosyltransferase-like PRPP-binding protein